MATRFAMLTSMRHYENGGIPVLYGWPFFRTTMTDDGVRIAPAMWLPLLNAPRINASWTDVDRVEKTQKGLRFVFKGNRKAVAVASPYKHERLADAASHFPVEVDLTIHPSTWFEI